MIGSHRTLNNLRALWTTGWALRFSDGSWSRTGCYQQTLRPKAILFMSKIEVGGITAVCRVAP